MSDEAELFADHAVDRIIALESQNQALQERIETAARYVGKMNHTVSREGWHTSQHCARCDLEPLLSPAQETDVCASSWCGKPRSHKVHMTTEALASGIHPSGTHRFTEPTQETDPDAT